jgi:hypothetical protein
MHGYGHVHEASYGLAIWYVLHVCNFCSIRRHILLHVDPAGDHGHDNRFSISEIKVIDDELNISCL